MNKIIHKIQQFNQLCYLLYCVIKLMTYLIKLINAVITVRIKDIS